MLNLTTNTYKETGKGLSKAAMDKLLPQLKHEFEWLELAYSQSLQRVTFNLSTAFQNFFEGRAKYPTFKNKFAKQSVAYPQNVKLKVSENAIKFPGTLSPPIKAVFHRVLPTGKQGCVTVSKTTDGKYFASILFDTGSQKVEAKNAAIGVDLGLKDFAVTSDGETHNQSKRTQRKLKKLERNQKRKQRKLARKKGQSNRNKAKRLVAKVCAKIARIREDFLHKLSRFPGLGKPSDCGGRSSSQEHGQKSESSQSDRRSRLGNVFDDVEVQSLSLWTSIRGDQSVLSIVAIVFRNVAPDSDASERDR